MRDLISNNNMTRGALQTLSGTTPNASALMDMQGFAGLTAYLLTGTITDAGDAAGFTMKLQHSDSVVGTSFVDVPADELIGSTLSVTVDTQDDLVIGGIGYVGKNRYVRAVFTGTTGTNAIVSVLFHRGKPRVAPTTQVGSTTAST
jgi:hypothetical protein